MDMYFNDKLSDEKRNLNCIVNTISYYVTWEEPCTNTFQNRYVIHAGETDTAHVESF